MRPQAVEPGKFVIELGTGARVAVWEVERGDQHPVHGSLDISGVSVSRIAR